MDIKDINDIEIGESCFGEILRLNGIDYEDINQEDVLNMINYLFKNNLNKHILIKECFKISIDYISTDVVNSNQDKCDQCGNWNTYTKLKVIK